MYTTARTRQELEVSIRRHAVQLQKSAGWADEKWNATVDWARGLPPTAQYIGGGAAGGLTLGALIGAARALARRKDKNWRQSIVRGAGTGLALGASLGAIGAGGRFISNAFGDEPSEAAGRVHGILAETNKKGS